VTPRKLILVVIDGLAATTLEAAIERGDVPTIARLAQHGSYARALSTFPSLTPVCLSSIATGAHPDVHGIPHLVWYHRREARVVEYGSSFGAMRAAGLSRSIRDTLVGMNEQHLSRSAVTVFEALDDAGLVPASVNFTAYRGRTEHRVGPPLVGRTVHGPRRFFFYSLFESDATGAPLSWRSRRGGTVDAYATAVGRWLVTRDGFDFLLFYLSDLDYAGHLRGPDAVSDVLKRCDKSIGELAAAAGGFDAMLERYAVVVMADHGQTQVRWIGSPAQCLAGVDGARFLGSNRAGQVYRLAGCRLDPRQLAARFDAEASVEVALFREGEEAVARRAGEELRFAPTQAGWRLSGDATILSQPAAAERAWAALANPNAGEVVLTAASGWEFLDLGGGHHLGGGSHGSLEADDSTVPVVTVGVEGEIASIVDAAPVVLEHFGVPVPDYVRPIRLAA
jgi:hypothetical protein